MGGDMFPLPSQIPSRAQDYGIEIKGEAGSSGVTAEEKGKTKVVNIIRLDKGKDDINAMVMPLGKRTTREQETSDVGPSHKRGKQAETGTGKEKKKKKPRRHYNTSDIPLGEGQPNYNLWADLVGRKADVTFGQLMEMCPRLKRQWKRMVNPMKNEPTKRSVRVLSLNELPHICPTIDAWHKQKCIGEAYIDGGAQDLEVEVFDVKALVNCHVMPVGIGAFPLILGRPWLQATKAVQDWGHGTITLYNRSGDKKKFDMATKKSLDANFDEDDDDDEYSSSEEDDGEESSELDDSSDDRDVEVSSDRELCVDRSLTKSSRSFDVSMAPKRGISKRGGRGTRSSSMALQFGSFKRRHVEQETSSRIVPRSTPVKKKGKWSKRCIFVDDEAQIEEGSNVIVDEGHESKSEADKDKDVVEEQSSEDDTQKKQNIRGKWASKVH
ncbi:hypothetical protein L7F22_035557 [Adiantum nelumboides]|nr:hypothetical protein [Adiantum nelumboides]